MIDGTANSDPIGRVTIRDDAGTILVTLLGFNRWQVSLDGEDSPELAELYRRTYRDFQAGPADGFPEVLVLQDLARNSGGVMELLRQPGGSSEAIY